MQAGCGTVDRDVRGYSSSATIIVSDRFEKLSKNVPCDKRGHDRGPPDPQEGLPTWFFRILFRWGVSRVQPSQAGPVRPGESWERTHSRARASRRSIGRRDERARVHLVRANTGGGAKTASTERHRSAIDKPAESFSTLRHSRPPWESK